MVGKIYLEGFRNFNKRSFEFSDDINVIVGPNASGKTNILESIYLLSTGKSFHARIEEEMINYASDLARIKGSVSASGTEEAVNLEVILTRGRVEVGESSFEKVPRKKLMMNKIAKRLFNFAGNLKIVLFGPWDMDLVTESPSIRRRFLDSVLSQVDREYRRASLSYEKGLRQRNKLLFRIREEGIPRGSLLFWDQLLIKNGNYITQKREEFIEFTNGTGKMDNQNFTIEYDRSTISEGRLEQYKDEELAAATTLVGPHRDDFVFHISNTKNGSTKSKKRELARYGSRGEQRMGVLWLKMAELLFIEIATGEKPTLLLDDIFSELDHEHRDIVMDICKNQQTVITTADPHYLAGIENKNIIKL